MDQTATLVPTNPASRFSFRPGDAATGIHSADNITGRYELLEEIARGGMGVVHRAFDKLLDREVALKLVSERHLGDDGTNLRFIEEARITGQLQHPGIPPIHDLGTLPDGRPFLAMKLIKGKTLEKMLREDKPGAGQKLAVFESVCQAMAYAHSRRVIHRDLKPANIMVGAFGETQVMDWGLAKVIDPDNPGRERGADPVGTTVINPRSGESSEHSTQAGSAIGTYAYMPPEQALGAKHLIGPASDVFGLGAVLCELLTDKPIYVKEGDDPLNYLAASAKLDPGLARNEASDADPELKALCKRCLSPDTRNRPADAQILVAEVASFRQATEERARRAETQAAKASQRRKFLAGLALVLLAGAAASLYLAFQAREAGRLAEIQAVKAEAEAAKAAAEAVRANESAVAAAQMSTFLVGLFEAEDKIAFFSANLRFRDRGGNSARVSDLLERGVERLKSEKGLKGHPVVRARLLHDIAAISLGIGNIATAKELAGEALAMRRKFLAKEDPDFLKSLRLAAQLEYLDGDYLTCLELHREVIALLEAAGDPDNLDLAEARASLAVCLSHVPGNYAEYKSLLESAADSYRRKLGPQDLRTISAGWMLLNIQETGNTLQVAALVAKLQRELQSGSSNPELAKVLELATKALFARGSAGEAAAWRAVVAQVSKVFGDSHYMTIRAKLRLGEVLYEGNSATPRDYAKAAEVYEEAMKDGSRWDRNFSRFHLARCWMRLGRREEAVTLLEATVAEFRRQCNELNASHLPHALELLTWLYDASGDPVKRANVKGLLEESMEAAKTNPFTLPGRVFLAMMDLVRYRMAREPSVPALPLLEEIQPFLKAGSTNPFDHLEWKAYYEFALRAAGRVPEAEKLRADLERSAKQYAAGEREQSARIMQLLAGQVPLWQGREGLGK